MNCLSFDVGGTTVKYGVIDESYKILKKDKIPTPENENDFIYSLSKFESSCPLKAASNACKRLNTEIKSIMVDQERTKY